MSEDVDAIAIVGMACRFPGARTPEEFFELLLQGAEPAGPEAAARAAREGRPLLEDVDLFDAALFGFSPREAEAMDPQQRVFLEVCLEALQRAGHEGDARPGIVGVYAGVGHGRYYLHHVLPNLGDLQGIDPFRAMLLNEKDFLATQVSYKLNLTGPSMSIQTGCSTSLVAVAVACEALLGRQCDVALAGGVAIDPSPPAGPSDSAIMSRDGRCRAFDVHAQGTIAGSGAAVVALKRLEDALADGDHVHAVIRGAALNNDGARKVGFTAPSVEGQAEVIAEAQAAAGVSPDEIGYVEAHGTGTPLGDPIEVAALTKAFRAGTTRVGFSALGAVKTNVGHTDAAAGAAGLLKAALALERGVVPPTLHFQTPNPALALETSPFRVHTSALPWPRGATPRRAGVSSFGMGGTNAHVVLEEAPAPAPGDADARPQVLVLSARTPAALAAASAQLADHLERRPDLALADVAHTLQVGRRRHAHRRALVCRDAADAVAALRGAGGTRHDATLDRPVAFLFPGQGAQHVGMGRDLYETEPTFRAEVDRCAAILRAHLGLDVRDVLYPPPGREEEASRRLAETALTQPCVFVVSHALARLWMSWGVRPALMIGHSLGEYVAACLAGVLSLEDALALVAARGRLMQDLPRGAMLAVALPEDDVRALLEPGLSLAAVNAPASCVVSGPVELVDALQARLEPRGVETRRLAVSHAFHSAMMDPALPRFEALVRSVALRPPRVPYVSNLTGELVTAAEATDPAYWVRHLRETVQFSEGATRLLKDAGLALLEVGPGRTLTSLAAQQEGAKGRLLLTSMRRGDDARPDGVALREALARLWAAGATFDWPAIHGRARRLVLPLPTYPFERQRYWLERGARASTAGGAARPPRARREAASPRDLLHHLAWLQSPSPPPAAAPDRWVVLADAGGLAEEVAARLPGQAILVRAGAKFEARADGTFVIDPARREDFLALADALRTRGDAPASVAHFWCLTPEDDDPPLPEALDLGFHALVRVADALRPSRILVASSHVQDVSGDEPLHAAKATLLAACRVLPQEREDLLVRSVDVDARAPRTRLVAQLRAELASNARDTVVAWRGPRRWTQRVEPIAAPDQPTPRLRDGGAYLVTGGLGGVGLALAEHLARAARARLVLVGRTGLPPRDAWDAWLASNPQDDRTARAILKVRAIEEAGGRVLVLAADVTDPDAMRRVVDEARREFGRIDGVVHAAGAIDARLAVRLSDARPEDLERQLRPKTDGLRVLQEVIRADPPDFLLATSSLAAVLGGVGFGPYAAANLHLDALARRHARDEGVYPLLSVGWDGWRLDGREIDPDAPALAPEEGAACFDLALALGAPHVLVAKGDVQERVRRWVDVAPPPAPGAASASASPGAPDASAPGAGHERPDLASAYVAPRDPVEAGLAQIWGLLLGFRDVGVHDDFFELGGHSLLATRVATKVKEAFGVDLPVRALFETPTVEALARLVAERRQESAAPSSPPIRPVPRDVEILPLSFAQQRLWFLDQWEPGSPAYNLSFQYRLTGDLKAPVLERALDEIVRRHEVLRTTFATVKGEPTQVIRPHAPLRLDVTTLEGDDRRSQADALAREEARRPFDLVRGPVCRFRLLRLGEREHVLLATIHHVAFDGWSQGVFLRELTRIYAAYAEGRPSPLPELPVQYADFAHWQRAWLEGSGAFDAQLAYWRERLRGLQPLDLPTDRPRPATRSVRGAWTRFVIPKDAARRLKDLAKEENATLFMPLLASLQALLRRYTGQDDVAVGSPLAGRNRPEQDALIGFFVNTLVLRTDLSGNPTFRELLRRVRETCLGGYAHQDLPFEKLVEDLQPERDPSRPPLFQVSFVLQNAHGEKLDVAGLQVSMRTPDTGTSKFDLGVSMTETDEGIEAVVEYNTDLFDAATIQRMLAHHRALVERLARDPEARILDVPLLTEDEERALDAWAGEARPYPRDATVHGLFEARAAAHPDRVAVLHGGASLTYGELDARATRLARCLRAQGVRRSDLVGLLAERSPDALVGMLGVLKAGGAYVPLDPAYPPERLAFMIEDARASMVVAQPRLADLAGSARVVLIDADDDAPGGADASGADASEAAAEDAAYVMYTSGSTGVPKGVVVPHRAIVRLATGAEYADLREEDVLLQYAPLAFDASTFEVWGALLAGARLAVAPAANLSLAELGDVVQSHGVTVLWLTAPLFRRMMDDHPEGLRGVRVILTGGDVVSPAHARAAVERLGCRVVNGYGPTENTTFTCAFPLDAENLGDLPPDAPLPIGRPIANTRVHVLDECGRRVPVGVPGELHAGGDGLALGYHERPELTSERFVTRNGERLYRTGDLVRWRADGNVEFLGRIDHQVKVRGFRVEPGEIEAVLAQHPSIKDALVVAREDDGERTLVAYVVPASADAGALRDFLKARLPPHMVPSAFVPLDAFPLTPNGKVDRKALPAPEGQRAEYVPPSTPTERALAVVWEELLKAERVGAEDNFFDLGGHSLLATRVLTRARDEFGVDVSLRAVFEAPTLRAFARRIDERLRADAPEASPAEPDEKALEADAVLDPDVCAGMGPEREGPPRHVLVTGGTGFVGAFLVHELLATTDATVHCLVRAPDAEQGKRRLREALESYGVWDDALASRLVAVPGDLARPRLGLRPDEFQRFGRQLDAVYHNGAMIGALYTYAMQRAPNVLGTKEALRLAGEGRRKPFHYVSTLAVVPPDVAARGVVREAHVATPRGLHGPYAKAKWASEQLVRAAGERGLPVSVYRLTRVVGHSATGAWNGNDIIARLVRDCIEAGKAPLLRGVEAWTPVDYVAKAIVHLSLRPASRGKIFHLADGPAVGLSHLAAWIRQAGYPLEEVPAEAWRERLQAGPLGEALLLDEAPPPGSAPSPDPPVVDHTTLRFDDANAREGLVGSAIACPPVDAAFFARSLAYLARAGHLPPPNRSVN